MFNVYNQFSLYGLKFTLFTHIQLHAQQVRRQCRSIMATSHPATLSSYFTTPLSPDHIADLHRQMPTFEQAQRFLDIYVYEFAWYHSCFSRYSYETEARKLYDPRESATGSSDHRLVIMAITYSIARMSIMKLTPQAASDLKLPVNDLDRTALSKKWLSASVDCLKCAGKSYIYFDSSFYSTRPV